MSHVHGTPGGYRAGCSCDECRRAELARHHTLRLRHVDLGPNDPRHGRRGTYNGYGCRCEACRAANTDYRRKRAAL